MSGLEVTFRVIIQRRTLAAVFLVAVVHAVQHVIAAPAPRDAVGTIQTQKLIFSALLHTANLSAEKHHESSEMSASFGKQLLSNVRAVRYEAAPLRGQTAFYLLLWITRNCTDLIGAIQTVIVSITPQAGWHTPSTGTHVLVHRTWREHWRRAECQSVTIPAFSSSKITLSAETCSLLSLQQVKNCTLR